MVRGAVERPTYLLQACRIEGRDGLYVRDLFNRSAYRRKLGRLGMDFAERPFVCLDSRGKWVSDDWPSFEPSYFVFASGSDDPTEVVTSTSGLLLFQVAAYRLRAIPPSELTRLADACKPLEVIAAGDPQVLVSRLTRP